MTDRLGKTAASQRDTDGDGESLDKSLNESLQFIPLLWLLLLLQLSVRRDWGSRGGWLISGSGTVVVLQSIGQ